MLVLTLVLSMFSDRGFSPEINVCIDPRFGRTEENFGEDPCLVAAMGVAAVTGLQGNNTGGPSTYLDGKLGIVSEAKHAAAYGAGGKDGAAADISPRTLHDVFLRPWKEYAEAGGRGAMLSHNSVNDVPAHSNKELMDQIRAWGVTPGLLMASDMCDIGLLAHPFGNGKNYLHGTSGGFGVAKDLPAAAALSMSAGMDQELCNPTDGRGQAFTLAAAAVKSGALAQSALDRAVGSVLRSKFAARLFDAPLVRTDSATLAILDNAADRALAKRAAVEGCILLQNKPAGRGGKNVLPLSLKSGQTVAIIGPLAGDAAAYKGGYTNSGAPLNTVLSAAAANLPQGVKLINATGAKITGNDTSLFTAAVAAAGKADVIVAVVGDSTAGWAVSTCGEDDDRTQLELPGVQPELLAAIAAKYPSKPMVAVLIHGRPVSFQRHDLLSSLDAVLAAWRPGEEGGNAIWSLLLGKDSPSGRLSQAWAFSAGYVHSQASPWFHKRQGDFDEEPYRGGPSQQPGPKHQAYPWGPMFPFQHGLSFTTFNTTVTKFAGSQVDAETGKISVTIKVSNTGAVASKTVVAIYHSKPVSSFVRFHRMLTAFRKTPFIAAGSSTEFTLHIPVSKLSSYDLKAKAQAVEAGDYYLQIVEDASASKYGLQRRQMAQKVTVTAGQPRSLKADDVHIEVEPGSAAGLHDAQAKARAAVSAGSDAVVTPRRRAENSQQQPVNSIRVTAGLERPCEVGRGC